MFIHLMFFLFFLPSLFVYLLIFIIFVVITIFIDIIIIIIVISHNYKHLHYHHCQYQQQQYYYQHNYHHCLHLKAKNDIFSHSNCSILPKKNFPQPTSYLLSFRQYILLFESLNLTPFPRALTKCFNLEFMRNFLLFLLMLQTWS